jgi:hypothetical protein
MQSGQTAPQGIDAILSALSVGGQPNGQLGKLPSAVNPINSPGPMVQPGGGIIPQSTDMLQGLPQSGATDPLSGALGDLNPEMLQMIIQALLQGGAFNQGTPPVT